MEKIDLNKLKTFYHVALEGSYQKASVYLGIKSSYISKHITSLENIFKFKLFKRSHRSLVLTEKGQELFQSVQIMMNQVEKIEEISNFDSEDDDTIRIVTTAGVTNLWLIRKLSDFITLYPKYKLRIIAIDEKIDIVNHFADVAILPKIDPNPNVVQRKLFTFHAKLFAAKKYLDKFGVPKTPEDLDHHRLISYYHNEVGHRGDLDWHLKLGAKNKIPRIPFLVINSAIGLYEAAVQGLGIVVITEEFPYFKRRLEAGFDDFDLIKVLPDEGVEIPIYFATHHQKLTLSKVAALEKFFKSTS